MTTTPHATTVTSWGHHLRARGLLWAAPGSIVAVLLAAVGADWIATRPHFDHWGRVPAVTLGALIVAILATAPLNRADHETEGSPPRPTPTAELAAVLGIATGCALLAALAITDHPLQRGGLEMARNLAGLTGLALIGASLAGPRLGWLLPFTYTSISYFSVARVYDNSPHQAVPGWLMFPATWPITHIAAGTLLLLGLLAWNLLGSTPRLRHHPLR